MKIPAPASLSHLLLAALLALARPASAQETATASASATEQAPVAPSAPAQKEDAAGPAPATAATAPEAPVAETPAPAAPSENSPAPLRRLDLPASSESSSATPADAPAQSAETEHKAESQPDESAAQKQREKVKHPSSRHRSHGGGDERVTFGHNSTLGPDEHAQAVVSIFGSSTAAGDVDDAVVSVLGSSTTSGRVGNTVVSILGSSRVTGGKVGGGVVSVLGSSYVNAKAHGGIVAVLGNVELGPDADVGDIVCVGGTLKRDPAAIVRGEVNQFAFGGGAFEGLGGGMEWLHAWVTQCVFLLRPLAFGPHLLWAWWIALAFLGLYALIALAFPGAVEKCAMTLEQRPGYSVLTSLFTVLLTPIVIILLCITVVGIALVPFLGGALFFATLFGKAVMLTWIGRCITKHLNAHSPVPAVLSTLAGGVIVLLLYLVPVLGFITYKVLGVLGLGVVVYTLILGTKKKPAPAAGVTPPPPVAPFSGTPHAAAAAGTTSAGFGSPTTDAVIAAIEPPQSIPAPRRIPVSAVTLPRAGFWIRIAASLIDALSVAITVHVLPNLIQPNFLFAYAVYCVVLWALKGTTLGGIVCHLRIVRVDDRPMDWPTAVVRGLGGFLSFIAAGLGFIWVAFDDQKQSWHDKIAGTTIVVTPRGVPLV